MGVGCVITWDAISLGIKNKTFRDPCIRSLYRKNKSLLYKTELFRSMMFHVKGTIQFHQQNYITKDLPVWLIQL